MLLPIPGVRTNTILCLICKKWVHKRCSGIRESLRNCKNFICKTCTTVAEADDSVSTWITVGGDEFETVGQFYYLSDVRGQAGRCIDAVTACI